jgi:Ca2+-binding EF-hand superfamily protein
VRAEPQRLLFLTSGGPLIVHVEAYVDGQSQQAAAEALLAELLKSVTENDQAGVTWLTLVELPKIAYGELGNATLADEAARMRAADNFDANNDKRVQLEEFAAFLSGDTAGGEASAVTWTDNRTAREKWSSPIFILLDADQDGRLSTEECAAAPVRLRSRDVDDNDAVTIADFRPPEMPVQMRNYQSEPSPTRGFALERFSLDSIYYTLAELYSADLGLQSDLFVFAPDLFGVLDTNANDRVTQRELAGLLEARPNVLVRVDYSLDAAPQLSLIKLADTLKAAGADVEQSPGRISINLPDCRLDLHASDAVNPDSRFADAQARFARLDTSNDLVLDSKELARAKPPVEIDVARFDKNNDGKLSIDEIRGELAGKPNYRDVQLRFRLAEEADPLIGWLDETPDGRLTSRELSNAASRLLALDVNHDGLIVASEIPDRLSCAIERSGQAMDMNRRQPPAIPASRAADRADVPRWLAAMDQNGDGEISRREFLGTTEQFRRLDANADGFLNTSEANAAEPQPNAAEKPPAGEITAPANGS